MDIRQRVEELARRTGVRVDRALALAVQGRLDDRLAFDRVVEALLEVEVRRGECAPARLETRRREIRQVLELLAAAVGGDDRPPETEEPSPRR